MKGIRLWLARGYTEAIETVRRTDAVWLKRDVMEDIDISTSDVYTHNSWYFAYDMIGYTGYHDVFHATEACDELTGTIQRIPETKALKWDYTYCDECIDRTTE